MTARSHRRTTDGTSLSIQDASQPYESSNEASYEEKSVLYPPIERVEQEPWKIRVEAIEGSVPLFEHDELNDELNRKRSIQGSKAEEQHYAHKRPSNGARQATAASIAAAPYAGAYCGDPEKPRELVHGQETTGTTHPRSSSSSSSVPTVSQVPSNLATASRVSTDAYGNV